MRYVLAEAENNNNDIVWCSELEHCKGVEFGDLLTPSAQC